MPGGTCGLFPSLAEQHNAETVRQLSDHELFALAIKTWGEDAQTKMVLEEMSELQKEICKHWRGKQNLDQIADEIADVEIMLDQLKLMHDLDWLVEEHRQKKLARLEQRLGVK